MSENKAVKGYKVFKPDWTCWGGFQYEVGKCYEMDERPVVCERGFHFCRNLVDCYKNYVFDSNNKVAEITAYGEIITMENESCTNKIKIERKIDWDEVLAIVNTGKGCTGLGNNGDSNSGNYNMGNNNIGNNNKGDRNTGNHNRGVYNTGSFNNGGQNSGSYNLGYDNSGNHNMGHSNSGNYNDGNYNSGNYNNGDYNAGDYNVTNDSSGCFNTEPTEMFFFNKLSNWTREDWEDSKAKFILDGILVSPTRFICEKDMTEEEKKEYPEYQITGFCLKKLSWEERVKINQRKWNQLNQKEKDVVISIPNFDKAIFKEVTGIDVDRE